MNEKKSVFQAFGGVKLLAVLAVVLVVGIYQSWERDSSQSSLQAAGVELGLNYFQEGNRPQLRGRIDDIGVAIDVTTDGVGSNKTSSVYYFTRFRLYPEGGPYGKIVGASLRQSVIEGLSDEEPIPTGDPAFDEAVLVFGNPADLLAHLGPDARGAVKEATAAGWALDGFTWEVKESGRMTNPDAIRRLLEIGLQAARATRQ